MTTSNVYQGLQSCLEPGMVEPRVLRLKLTQPKSNSEPENTDMKAGLSFLQALAGPSRAAEPEKVYVHPMVKRSASTLSATSLDMCTESLGSETGRSYDDVVSAHDETEPPRPRRAALKRRSRSCVFPPPLTSVAGIKVRPHRQAGRLVLKAVSVPPPSSFFRAERRDGRLRLRLVSFEPSRAGPEDDGEIANEIDEEEGEENDANDDDEEEYSEYDDSDEDDDGGDDVDEEGYRSGNSGVKMVKGKPRRYGRCKEDNNNNNNNDRVLWDRPYLVAT